MPDDQEELAAGANGPVAVVVKLPGISFTLTGPLALIPVAILFALVVVSVVFLARSRTQPLLWVSAVLWILFILYWSSAAKNASPAKTSESPASRRFHQLVMYGSLVLAFISVPGLSHRWLPFSYWFMLVGFCIHIGSALLSVWARWRLGRNWSGEITAKVDHELIRTGPYRVIRHPIYTGTLGMFLGTAFVSGQLHALLAFIIMSLAYVRKIRLEERNLKTVFGVEYDEYRRKSWAVIPGLL